MSISGVRQDLRGMRSHEGLYEGAELPTTDLRTSPPPQYGVTWQNE